MSEGFQVRDRRRFSADGSVRDEAAAEEPAPEAAAEEKSAARDRPSPSPEPGPEITLSAFLMSLSTQALLSLGEVEDPLDGKTKEDLRAARELIDILAMLRDKTRGNLDAAESSLLENVLYDLRMRYVRKVRK